MMESTRKTKVSISHLVSAETIASNDDLLTEILLRMPIKSLIKFKCVSKQWFSLISDPGFAHRRSSSLVSASGLFLKRHIDCYDSDDYGDNSDDDREDNNNDDDKGNNDNSDHGDNSDNDDNRDKNDSDDSSDVGDDNDSDDSSDDDNDNDSDDSSDDDDNSDVDDKGNINDNRNGDDSSDDDDNSDADDKGNINDNRNDDDNNDSDDISDDDDNNDIDDSSDYDYSSDNDDIGNSNDNRNDDINNGSDVNSDGDDINKERIRLGYDGVALTSAAVVPPFSGDQRFGIDIRQSCNGLLFCCKFHSNDLSHSYYIYNPTTKHYATLPRPPYRIAGFALAFDPSESPHYKVIAVTFSGSQHDFRQRILVYSSESRSWRSTRASFGDTNVDICFDRCVVFCNGAVHWMDFCEGVDSAPYFHIATEEIRRFETFNSDICFYGVSRDCLHAVHYESEMIDSRFDVFELERDYSKWVVKYRVDISGILRAFPATIPRHLSRNLIFEDYKFSVISVVRCEIEEDSFLVMDIGKIILVYNFRTGSFNHLCDCTKEYDVFEYVESLACV